MKLGSLTNCLVQAGLSIVLCGCATIEVTPDAATPEITVQRNADAPEHATPPPLPLAPPADEPESVTPAAPQTLELTLEQAIVTALDHNQSLKVQEITPAIRETAVATQRAAFDPSLNGGYTRSTDKTARDLLVRTPVSIPGDTPAEDATLYFFEPVETETRTYTDEATVGLTQHLPTGTDLSLTFGPSRTETRHSSTDPGAAGGGNDTKTRATTVNVTLSQSLLRGAGLGPNLAGLRQARLNAESSEYELRGFVEDLVAQVEQTYWDYVLAERQIKIYEDSLALAEAQAAEIGERIRIGKVAETERAAAEAEVAQRRSSLINARSALATVRLQLLRLLNPAADAMQTAQVRLLTQPVVPEIKLDDIARSLESAHRLRPDLNQARLLLQRDDLELVRTKNGLLPRLDLFISLGRDVNRTDYAAAFTVNTRDERDERTNTQVGVQFSYPIGNRAARADHIGAQLARRQDAEALTNMAQLVEQDVHAAYVELRRAREQIAATAATVRLQEETLKVESEKYRLGRSTVLLVSQAQRDLLSAHIDEVQAQTDYLKAIVDLYRVEGTLLVRRGVKCPGQETVLPD